MRPVAWRTDVPCPVCANGLTVLDDGGSLLLAECRLCGHGETWPAGDQHEGEW